MEKRNLTSTAKQKEMMIKALEANYGNIRKAAKLTKIAPSTHYRWLKEDRVYAEQTENMRDISYRNIKDDLLDLALAKAKKGSEPVLNKLLGMFFKNLQYEMDRVKNYNNVPIRVNIVPVDTPQDPARWADYKKPE